MSKQLPAEGDYVARCNGQLKIIKANTGTLGVAVPYKLIDSDVSFTDTHVVYIAKADGTLMQANIDNLKVVFGWDGIDPWWLSFEDPETGKTPRIFEVDFKLSDCKHEEYTPEGKSEPVTVFKPSWLNPVDGQRKFQMAERGEFMKAFGSKFRAAAGPAAKSPTAKSSASTSRKAPMKSAPTAEPCTMEEAWAALEKKESSKNEEQRANIWWAKIEEMFGKEKCAAEESRPGALTRAEYGQLRAALIA